MQTQQPTTKYTSPQKNIHPSPQSYLSHNLIPTFPVIPHTSTDTPQPHDSQEQHVSTSLPRTLSLPQKDTHNSLLPQKRKIVVRLPRRVRKAIEAEDGHKASSIRDPTAQGVLFDDFVGKHYFDSSFTTEPTASKSFSVSSTAAEEVGLIKPPTSL